MEIDADGWQKILTLSSYAESSSKICQVIDQLIRKVYPKKLDSKALEDLLTFHLTPLEKSRSSANWRW